MINLPDKDLTYLPQGTEHFEDYVRAVHWAQGPQRRHIGYRRLTHECQRRPWGEAAGKASGCRQG